MSAVKQANSANFNACPNWPDRVPTKLIPYLFKKFSLYESGHGSECEFIPTVIEFSVKR